MDDNKNIAVILAGGSGRRFGAGVPKQFLALAGRTVIEHSIEAFERNGGIDEVAVVMHADFLDEMRRILDRNGWRKVRKILPGGAERHLSTFAALDAYHDFPDANLILHDAARPAVSQRIVNDVVVSLKTHPAVAVAIPSADTVFEVSDERTAVVAIPDRQRLRCAQTPQAFRCGILRDAYDKALEDSGFTCTDDCGVILRYRPDIPIHLVDGDIANRKLTYPEDAVMLERALSDNAL